MTFEPTSINTIESKNSMLEPFRRVIESVLPTNVDEFRAPSPPQLTPFQFTDPEDDRLKRLMRESNKDIAKWSSSYPSQVTINSPENPLLGLSQEEFSALQ